MINTSLGAQPAEAGQPFTPVIIDIEASGFGCDSYPIEIGVALSTTQRFCRLIRPQPDWLHWSKEAEALHGISRSVLVDKGVSVSQVCQELNQLLQTQTVFSDGWVVDSPWLNRMYESAGMSMSFKISPLEVILSETQMDLWHPVKDSLFASLHESRHRASSDATLILLTYIETRDASMAHNSK
ncbi:MAG: hypothetical protein ACI9C4_001158 [Paraglaciecola sp.]